METVTETSGSLPQLESVLLQLGLDKRLAEQLTAMAKQDASLSDFANELRNIIGRLPEIFWAIAKCERYKGKWFINQSGSDPIISYILLLPIIEMDPEKGMTVVRLVCNTRIGNDWQIINQKEKDVLNPEA